MGIEVFHFLNCLLSYCDVVDVLCGRAMQGHHQQGGEREDCVQLRVHPTH